MVMQKPSKFMDIDPILFIFAGYGRLIMLIYINLYVQNEENLPQPIITIIMIFITHPVLVIGQLSRASSSE